MVAMKNSTNPLFLIAKDWLQYLPTSIAPAILTLIASAIFTRMFPPHIYGLFSLAIALSIPITNAFSQPLSQPIGRFYYEYSSKGKVQVFRQAVSILMFRVMLILLPIDALLGFWLIRSHRETPSVASALVVFIVLQVMTAALMPMILSSFQTRHYQVIILATTFLGVAIPFGFTIIFGPDISFLLWGNVVGSLIFLPIIYRWSNMHTSRPLLNGNNEIFPVVRRFLRYGLPFIPWFVSSSMLSIGDRYVLEWFHGPTSVAVYSVSYAMAQQALGLLSGPFMTALWPRLMQQWSTGGVDATRKLLRHVTNIYFIVGGLVVGLLFVDGHALMSILVGKQYVRGFIIIGPVAVGRAIWGSSIIGHKTMELTERNSLMVWDAVISAILNILLNIWWVPRYGMLGASIATIAGYMVYTGLIWYQSRSHLPWDISFKVVTTVVIFTLASIVIVDKVIVAHGALLNLFLSTALFIVLYGIGITVWNRRNLDSVKNLFARGE